MKHVEYILVKLSCQYSVLTIAIKIKLIYYLHQFTKITAKASWNIAHVMKITSCEQQLIWLSVNDSKNFGSNVRVALYDVVAESSRF